MLRVCLDAGSKQSPASAGSAEHEVYISHYQKGQGTHIEGKVHKAVVKVLAAEMCVSRCGLDLKDALINCQKRHIKGPSAQIEDQHLHLKVIASESELMTAGDQPARSAGPLCIAQGAVPAHSDPHVTYQACDDQLWSASATF